MDEYDKRLVKIPRVAPHSYFNFLGRSINLNGNREYTIKVGTCLTRIVPLGLEVDCGERYIYFMEKKNGQTGGIERHPLSGIEDIKEVI